MGQGVVVYLSLPLTVSLLHGEFFCKIIHCPIPLLFVVGDEVHRSIGVPRDTYVTILVVPLLAVLGRFRAGSVVAFPNPAVLTAVIVAVHPPIISIATSASAPPARGAEGRARFRARVTRLALQRFPFFLSKQKRVALVSSSTRFSLTCTFYESEDRF